jgi:hypothetical protein
MRAPTRIVIGDDRTYSLGLDNEHEFRASISSLA